MRARSAVTFLLGFIAGMLFLMVLMWSHGSLVLRPVRAAAPAVIPSVAATQPPATPPAVVAPSATVVPPSAVGSPPVASIPVMPQPSKTGEIPPLIIPVQGADPRHITDTYTQSRGSRGSHEATDIMAPRGTPVLAAANGTIARLFLSKLGGNTIYQFDPTRTWCFYYAHLDRYIPGLAAGQTVRQGQVIGYVGSTGDASPTAPHLHFAIFLLGPEKQWWKGTAIDPYPILMRQARQ